MKVAKIDICGVPYTITADKEVKASDGRQLAGQIDYYRRVIEVRNDLPRHMGPEILAHEVAHGVLAEGGARTAFTEQQQEIVCDIAGVVARIMMANLKAVEATVEAIGK